MAFIDPYLMTSEGESALFCVAQTLYGWVGSADGPGLFETRQAIIDKADHSDIVKLSDKYVRHDDLPGTVASI